MGYCIGRSRLHKLFAKKIDSVMQPFFGNTNAISPLENLELKQFGLLHGLFGTQWDYFPFAQRNWAFSVSYRGQLQLNELSGIEYGKI